MHLAALALNRPHATLLSLPDGEAGTHQTLKIMRQFVRRYKKDIAVRELALAIVRGLNGHKNFSGQVRALTNWVRDNIQYVKDIKGVETISTPLKTLEYRQGDCDDQAVLLASFLETIGHPTRFVAIKVNPFGPFVHVFTETKIGTRWYPLETTERWPAGKGPPIQARRMVVVN